MDSTKQRAPTLYIIIAIKLVKGIILLLLALGAYSLTDNDLPKDFHRLVASLHLDPERNFFTRVAVQLKSVTPSNLYWLASGTFFYSLFSLVEGVGLVFRVRWAGWLAIGESGFFIPIEIYELMKGVSVTLFIILCLNIFIVWYLLQNRARLFRHH
ncbi:MAG: DUF2127 domain-containing protein [Verrucomicrobiota bacterium]